VSTDRPISSAVSRVLARAGELAAAADRPVKPVDLLQALLDDEGHATELLREAGLTLQTVAETPELHGVETSQRSLLRAAHQHTPSGEETSSLQLLAAIAEAADEFAALFERHGLALERLRQLARGDSGSAAPPLLADVQIAPAVPAVDDLSATFRILDAAANRAREGLRVLEDHARFALNDAHLTQRFKQARHRLAELVLGLVGDQALRHRDTPRDVGTELTARLEARRASDADVLRANARRVQEALRSLEEFGKRIDPWQAERLERLRYDCYTLEQALLTTLHARERLREVRLCLLATDAFCPRGLGPVVRAALSAGCPMVQLREKNVPDGRLLERARFLREWTRAAGALFIVNDRPDLAVLVDADGVHVGQEDLPAAEARRIVGSRRLVGVSTHNVEQVRQAVLDGADYLGVGPVFPSKTKAFDELAGLEFVRQAAAETSLPWFALGGVTLDNLPQVLAAGARRVAVTSALCQADDPAAATRQFLERLAVAEAAEPDVAAPAAVQSPG
jgi:thiamine-phosphate pyrophosphorylase